MRLNQPIVEIDIPQFKHSKSNLTSSKCDNPVICPCTSLIEFLQLRKHTVQSDLFSPLWIVVQFLNNFSLISCVMLYLFVIWILISKFSYRCSHKGCFLRPFGSLNPKDGKMSFLCFWKLHLDPHSQCMNITCVHNLCSQGLHIVYVFLWTMILCTKNTDRWCIFLCCILEYLFFYVTELLIICSSCCISSFCLKIVIAQWGVNK